MQYQNTDNETNEQRYSLPEPLLLDTPFWFFSLSIWKHEAAQAALLTLQDEQGCQINRLLFATWLGLEKREMLVDELTKAPLLNWWHNHTVSTLRELRKRVSVSAPGYPALKATIQNAELQAEQIEQALLFNHCEQLSVATTKRNTLETLVINLLRYTQNNLNGQEQTVKAAALRPLLITLAHAAVPQHERSYVATCFPES